MIAWPLAPSRAAVGSSVRIADGSATIARAMATRCCSPPLKSRGKAQALCPSPTRSSTWRDLSLARRRCSPRTSSASHTFSWRIGLPFVFGVYVLMPIAYYPVYRVTAADPSWLAYWRHWTALPFWPGGPLWFLWQLLLFDILALVFFLAAPRLIEMLGRFSAAVADAPRRYFLVLLAVSTVSYLPLAFAFGVSNWAEFGPFDWQPDRPLLYLVYFFAGVGIGVQGYDRGLLRPDGALARQWRIWLIGAAASFLFWMITMAPSAYGHGNLAIDLCSYFAVVLVVAAVCLGFAAVFLRFGYARSALTDSLSENAYAIYLVHYVFVVWLQYALLARACLPSPRVCWSLPARCS